MTPRTFSMLTAAWTILGLVCVAGFNGAVDPFGQYATGILPPSIQNSRSDKLKLLQSYDTAPEGLILGSSRVHKFEPSYLRRMSNVEFFNAGVNHGRPIDYLAWVRWYHQRWNQFPKIVIIGVDSVALSPVVSLDGRITAEPELAAHVSEFVPWKDVAQAWAELVSFKQTKASLQSLIRHLKRSEPQDPVEYFADDGRIVYRQREAELEDGTYDFEAALQFNEREFASIFKKFDAFSMTDVRVLAMTVGWLNQHGTKVILFPTPYHPSLHATLSKLPDFEQRESEAAELLALIGKHHGATVVDLHDIATFDGDASHFVDGIHPLEPNTRRMIDKLISYSRGDLHAVQ